MNYKKYLSGVLAAAMVLNTGAVSVLAAGTDTSVQEARPDRRQAYLRQRFSLPFGGGTDTAVFRPYLLHNSDFTGNRRAVFVQKQKHGRQIERIRQACGLFDVFALRPVAAALFIAARLFRRGYSLRRDGVFYGTCRNFLFSLLYEKTANRTKRTIKTVG